ncbi:M20/M25/M40 family metallo-hydrolase [Aminirod propionatiphilus]|uniref:M20/M25/M40 family metallo-hydrolase n=1 Tax=Aminirod propionatiphilus TaxID=3415223 RepID=A0ACD1DWE2_9BACT|nr:M20/M25/M40 family metallo-hydrolase [Synergistota bacterium]
MNERESFFDAIGGEIEEILRAYVAVPSVTGTDGEREATRFFLDFFSTVPYFRAHRDHCGAYPLPGDPLARSVGWALAKGRGRETVVLIHHSDVVGVEDFRRCREEAFSPADLERALLFLREDLPDEARRDLESGRFLFGRGSCDMKGGGAIQMALLRRWSLAEREGNLLLLALPDEENLSAGMRAALRLLLDLQEKWGLDYRLMVDSEPHQRKDPERGLLSVGSVGKLMPFVYVRGSLSHAGKVFEGFNPLNLLCAVVRKTEGSPAFIDCRDGEASPPPTWLHLKDGKERYDVSMPLSAYGYFSVLTLGKEPAEVLEQVRQVCLEAFGDVLSDLQGSWDHFCRTTGRSPSSLPWRPRVMSFGELLDEARRRGRRILRKKPCGPGRGPEEGDAFGPSLPGRGQPCPDRRSFGGRRRRSAPCRLRPPSPLLSPPVQWPPSPSGRASCRARREPGPLREGVVGPALRRRGLLHGHLRHELQRHRRRKGRRPGPVGDDAPFPVGLRSSPGGALSALHGLHQHRSLGERFPQDDGAGLQGGPRRSHAAPPSSGDRNGPGRGALSGSREGKEERRCPLRIWSAPSSGITCGGCPW